MPAPADLAVALLDLIFPPRCVACGAHGAVLCIACRESIQPPRPPRCPRCCGPLPSAHARCPHCADSHGPHNLDRMIVASIYEGAVRKAIIALKYNGQRRAATPLGDLIAAAVRASDESLDIIVPVPLHASRRRARGYNQAELLARRCAHLLGVPCSPDALVRARATPPQVGLSLPERRRNIAGAFVLGDGARAAALAGRRVAVLDDVTTTGSTLEAAATALRAAGPAAIIGVAVAHPEHFADDSAPADHP
jgi:ComF family protein